MSAPTCLLALFFDLVFS